MQLLLSVVWEKYNVQSFGLMMNPNHKQVYIQTSVSVSELLGAQLDSTRYGHVWMLCALDMCILYAVFVCILYFASVCYVIGEATKFTSSWQIAVRILYAQIREWRGAFEHLRPRDISCVDGENLYYSGVGICNFFNIFSLF